MSTIYTNIDAGQVIHTSGECYSLTSGPQADPVTHVLGGQLPDYFPVPGAWAQPDDGCDYSLVSTGGGRIWTACQFCVAMNSITYHGLTVDSLAAYPATDTQGLSAPADGAYRIWIVYEDLDESNSAVFGDINGEYCGLDPKGVPGFEEGDGFDLSNTTYPGKPDVLGYSEFQLIKGGIPLGSQRLEGQGHTVTSGDNLTINIESLSGWTGGGYSLQWIFRPFVYPPAP